MSDTPEQRPRVRPTSQSPGPRQRPIGPGGDVNALNWVTPDGITVKPLYTAADTKDLPYADTLPGFEPFLRGPRPPCMRCGPGRSASTRFLDRRRIQRLLPQGAGRWRQGVSVAFDLATHRGYDSDRPPRVTGDVGKRPGGDRLGRGHEDPVRRDPLDKVSVSMTMNGAVLPAGRLWWRRKSRACRKTSSGTIQNDILKEFMVRNTYIYPPKPSMKIIGDIIEYTAKNMPKFNSISIAATTCRKPGPTRRWSWPSPWPTAEYVKTASLPGMDVDDLRRAPLLLLGHRHELLPGSGQDARRALLWCRIMKGFNAKNPKSLMLRTHCQTSAGR